MGCDRGGGGGGRWGDKRIGGEVGGDKGGMG